MRFSQGLLLAMVGLMLATVGWLTFSALLMTQLVLGRHVIQVCGAIG